jgi:flagellar basal body-associated protein FliL
MKERNDYMKKLISLLLVLLVSLMMLASCGAAENGALKDESAPTVGAPESPGGGEKNEGDNSYIDTAEDYARKIIKTYNIELETKNYSDARDVIVNTAVSLGGYVSDSAEKDILNHQNKKVRSASFTVRVPSEKADEYVDEISKNTSVRSKKLSTQDITTSYYDLESQLESLLDQEARIKKLMDEATSYTYLLQLDDKLTSIRTQINNINKQIQLYDKSVALSFVYVTLKEVVEYTEITEEEPTFGARIAEAFVGTFQDFWVFCQDLLVSVIWMLPTLIITAAVITVIVTSRKRKRKKKEAEKQAKEENK